MSLEIYSASNLIYNMKKGFSDKIISVNISGKFSYFDEEIYLKNCREFSVNYVKKLRSLVLPKVKILKVAHCKNLKKIEVEECEDILLRKNPVLCLLISPSVKTIKIVSCKMIKCCDFSEVEKILIYKCRIVFIHAKSIKKIEISKNKTIFNVLTEC